MSEATPPEATAPPQSRRGKWRRFFLRGLLLLGAAALLLHQPLLTAGLRLALIRLAARQNVQLELEVKGSVWTHLTIQNLRAVSTGSSPLELITVERLRVEYSLPTLWRSGPRDCLTFYNLRNATLVLDPLRGNPDQKAKLAHVLHNILEQPAMCSDRAQVENFNLTIRAREGTYLWKDVHALLDPVARGYIRVGEMTVPRVGSWHDLYSEATYVNRHLVMRGFNLGDEVQVARLELDASHRGKGVSTFSFEGTVLGGDLGLFLWQHTGAPGATVAQATAYLHNLPLAALSRYEGWRTPVTGNLKECWIHVGGNPLTPAGWQGELSATVEHGSAGGVAVDNAAARISVGGGVARLEKLELATGRNRLTLQAEHRLPQTFGPLRVDGVEAAFTLDAPELASLHPALRGGRAHGNGVLRFAQNAITAQGSVSASDVQGGDFGVERAQADFSGSHPLRPADAPAAPWYDGFSGRVRLEADGLRFREFAARHLALDLPVDGGTARIDRLALDLNGKNRLDGQAAVTLHEPFPYEGRLAGSVRELALFQPFFQTPIGGALEIDWHGTGQIRPMRHTGEGRVALRDGRVGTFTGVEGELAGGYSPESIDIPALRVRSDQGTLQAGVKLHNERLQVDGLRLTAGKNGGVLTGSLNLPLDLRTPDRPETVFPRAGALQGMLTLEPVDLARAFPANSSAPPSRTVRGALQASLTLAGSIASPDLALKITVRNLQSGAAEKLAPATGDAMLLFRENRLALSGSLAQPGLSPLVFKGAMPLDLAATLAARRVDPATPLTASIQLPPSPAAVFGPFFPGIRLLDGRFSVDASAAGTLEKPVFSGGIALDLPTARFQNTAIPGLNHFVGDLRFAGTELSFQRFGGDMAGGPFAVTGRIRLDPVGDPLLDVRLQSKNTLLVRNDTLTLRANSDLRLAGPLSKAALTGKIGFTKSRFYREVEILPIGLPGRPAPKPSGGRMNLSATAPPLRDWSYDIAIVTDEPFTVKGNLANGSIEGDLHLGGTGLAPTLEGTAHIENFVASLPFSRLTVDHGALYFGGNALLNPTLDIHGSSRIRDYNVNVYLYGTGTEPQTLFTSEPSLPQEEVVALLATGATTREFSQNNQALAGRAAVLLFQDLSRKILPKRTTSGDTSNPLDRFSLDVGGVDPRTGKQQLMGRLKLSDQYQIGAGVDMQGDVRMQLQYLLRFR